MRAAAGKPMAFIMAVVSAPPVAECVEWPFAKCGAGYGVLAVGPWHLKRVADAHRFVCWMAHGAPPAGGVAAHNCNNMVCVNPAHLRWTSQKDNLADRVAAGTAPIGERNGSAKLTGEQVVAIRKMWGKQRTTSLAKQFGVSRKTIWSIATRKHWQHIEA